MFHAKDNVRRAHELAALTADSRVLDIGCGSGRFLTGMLATYGRVRSYIGLDVRKPVIDWAAGNLTRPEWGDIRFAWLDLENARYNRAGGAIHGEHVLPIASSSVDVVVLFSVFSHMTLPDTRGYLHEIRRVLADGGRCYCTAFVEDDAPEWEENPADYLRDWAGPLHCARFNRSAFEGLAQDAGLTIHNFVYRSHPTKQSAYVLVP